MNKEKSTKENKRPNGGKKDDKETKARSKSKDKAEKDTKKDKKAASNGKEKKPKAHKKKEEEEDEEKIKRPSNPYIFFQNEQREILKKEKPDMAFKEIAAEIGNKWKALSEEEKKEV